MRRNFRQLTHDHGRNIYYFVTEFCRNLHAFTQQYGAVGTEICVVIDGKLMSDILLPACRQYRVAHSMAQHIGIGMTDKLFAERNRNSSEYYSVTLAEGMYVKAHAHTILRQITVIGNLFVGSFAIDKMNFPVYVVIQTAFIGIFAVDTNKGIT